VFSGKPMKKETISLLLVLYTFSLAGGSLYGVGESTLILGTAAGWSAVEKRTGIAEISAIRPNPVLTLSSARTDESSLDMALSFDEGRPDLFADRTGRYKVSAAPTVSATNYRWARSGTGSILFSGNTNPTLQAALLGGNIGDFAQGNTVKQRNVLEAALVITPSGRDALLFSGQHFKDFSLEFWLFPINMENGEQILSWTSTRQTLQGVKAFQRIQCIAARNRLQWSFMDFFSAPDDNRQLTLTITGAPVPPRSWSHHLIRFDGDTGLLEYLVNGNPEGVNYATSTGREGGEVYYPVAGDDGTLILGGRFTGLMDEFRTYSRYVETPQIAKYDPHGGRIETRPLDLGERQSNILKVEAFGGSFSGGGRTVNPGGLLRNEYTGASDFRFADDMAVQFFIRAADSPYFYTGDENWQPFVPGSDLSGKFPGRYVQLAAVLYPGGDGESAPYLDGIRITYMKNNPPLPPSRVTVTAGDGVVELRWRESPDRDAGGYLVYYGTARGEYFGEGAVQGISPIDVGKRTSVRIEGLQNGTLYFFAVSAYNRNDISTAGEFSREVSVRPLWMAQ
jgi:hypothetical protein